MYFNSYAAGYRIQKLRKAHGLTQEEAAIKLNISDRHMRSRRVLSGFFFVAKKSNVSM